jgi:hypothetical protein
MRSIEELTKKLQAKDIQVFVNFPWKRYFVKSEQQISGDCKRLEGFKRVWLSKMCELELFNQNCWL